MPQCVKRNTDRRFDVVHHCLRPDDTEECPPLPGELVCCGQSCPEKLRDLGQRVKVGPQGQGGFHSESTSA